MNKIALIIQREYLSRVRTRTFILITLLGPILYSAFFIVPVLAAMMSGEKRIVTVVDDSGKFKYKLKNGDDIDFDFVNTGFQEQYAQIGKKDGPEYLLHIPANFDIFKGKDIQLITQKSTSATFNASIENLLDSRIEELKMESFHLNKGLVDSLKSSVSIDAKVISEQGLKNSSSVAASIASYVGGLLIYMFIFLYGTMVLRGVQEEKQSRVVEVIISSVKPFQLMMGKIVGIALVGLSQFIVWVILTTVFYSIINTLFIAPHMAASAVHGAANGEMPDMIRKLQSSFTTLNFPLLIGMFLFYFLGGYLIYSSLFAGVAAATDSQSDAQQFMLPITLPIILSIMFLASTINNPDSTLSVVLSMIPLTSPIIMMARLPFGVPVWQIALSMFFLVGGFFFTTWLAGKIYRTGILLYGKKTNYRELAKWLFYKD